MCPPLPAPDPAPEHLSDRPSDRPSDPPLARPPGGSSAAGSGCGASPAAPATQSGGGRPPHRRIPATAAGASGRAWRSPYVPGWALYPAPRAAPRRRARRQLGALMVAPDIDG